MKGRAGSIPLPVSVWQESDKNFVWRWATHRAKPMNPFTFYYKTLTLMFSPSLTPWTCFELEPLFNLWDKPPRKRETFNTDDLTLFQGYGVRVSTAFCKFKAIPFFCLYFIGNKWSIADYYPLISRCNDIYHFLSSAPCNLNTEWAA